MSAALVSTVEGARLMQACNRLLELRVYDTGYDRNRHLWPPFLLHATGRIKEVPRANGLVRQFHFSVVTPVEVHYHIETDLRAKPVILEAKHHDGGWEIVFPDDAWFECYSNYLVELLSDVTGHCRLKASLVGAVPLPPSPEGRRRCAQYDRCGNYVLDEENRNTCYSCSRN